ncbi:MAG TPA: DEAD/DEAH box helicase [Acidimicrobiales bacterium]|nr:DEAD/DEAH box helicase [Acidimicrobiales bacterium]
MQGAPGAAGTIPSTGSTGDVEAAVQAEADGVATPDELALLEANQDRWRVALERLLDDAEDDLDRVRDLRTPERDQVIADFEQERDRLTAALSRLTGEVHVDGETIVLEAPGEVRLQASWSSGRLVVWAAGAQAAPAGRDELAALIRAVGAPTSGWSAHQSAPLPSAERAATQAIAVSAILGWLVTAGNDHGDERLGASVRWLGRVAAWAVHLVSQGALVPTLRTPSRARAKRAGESGVAEHNVRWVPATVDQSRLEELAATMPGPVAVFDGTDARTLTLAVLGGIVDAIATDAAQRLELPAPPPSPRTPTAIAEAFLTRLDGSAFEAPTRPGAELARRMERWANPVTSPGDSRLVVQLDPPDKDGAWYLSVLGPDPDGALIPVEVALVDSKSKRHLSDELARLERLLPVLQRPGGIRRGQVYLSQDEAWELMTETGPTLSAAGFDVRVPALSRRRPSPALRLETESSDETMVGAHQLADVRWSAVFDDVELSAAEIAALASQARPLVRSRGRWVELDQADLKEAAAALAERSGKTQLTGAEILRHAIGLEGAGLSGGISVQGSGWAADLLRKAGEVQAEPVTSPPGFVGELRSYQAEALAWLAFLDSVELGGCLALDMGLGKTPTVLAHLGRTAGNGDGTALVIAPPAVVGNWAAEAARFTPDLKVVVHHGASRSTAEELEAEVAGADIVITTYGTAVRDVEALAQHHWDRVILDEAQAIKNPANETAQQLRRIPADVRLALTGTPIENGLGDLWSILDFTNPGLVGTRPAFIAQLSADKDGARKAGESALRALNGILVFRRTKAEPVVARELPERIDVLDHCTMTPEQIGLYQAVLDRLTAPAEPGVEPRQGEILAAITALKQICNHPVAYQDDGEPLADRSGKLARLEEIVDNVFEAGERVLVFTHFAEWGKRLAGHLTDRTGTPIACYHGGLARGARDSLVAEFQQGEGSGALVLSLKAGGTGLNLTAASHVVLYDRWWNPAVEDQARDRAWRIGQTRTVVSHRLVCPGTVDERVEEVVSGKRHIADLVLPKSSSLADLDTSQLRTALGLRPDTVLTDDGSPAGEVAA